MKFILTDANRSFMKIIDIDNLESLLKFMNVNHRQHGLVIEENYYYLHPDEDISFKAWANRNLSEALTEAEITIKDYCKIQYELMIYDDWIE